MHMSLPLAAHILAAVVLYPWVAGRTARWLLPYGWHSCYLCGEAWAAHEFDRDNDYVCSASKSGYVLRFDKWLHRLPVFIWPPFVVAATVWWTVRLLAVRPIGALFRLGLGSSRATSRLEGSP